MALLDKAVVRLGPIRPLEVEAEVELHLPVLAIITIIRNTNHHSAPTCSNGPSARPSTDGCDMALF